MLREQDSARKLKAHPLADFDATIRKLRVVENLGILQFVTGDSKTCLRTDSLGSARNYKSQGIG